MTTTVFSPVRTPKTAPNKAATKSDVAPAVAASSSVEETEGPNYVSIYLSSIFAVTMAFLIGVGVPCSIFLSDWTGGMGLGAMCAFWGGPSFGVMAGSARVSAWLEANEDH